ncbi:MAG: trigger factor [Lachnospiraceae bacterium]|nr:trigger factor [Lachnospiraceae bacterium]
MSVQLERLEMGMAKLTIEVDADKVDAAINKAYLAQRGRVQVPGFRKGKAPRAVIERMYGREIFYEDAADTLVQESYADAAENCGEDVVSSPRIEVIQIEGGKPFIYAATVALKPEVGLGKYKGIAITKIDDTVTDEEVDEEIERQRKLAGRDVTVTDRAVQEGDTVKLDYEGSIDGVPFEGGKDEGHLLTIGSGAFIPGFEEGLIGKNTGDDCDVTVTFPEDYHASDLSGKEAVFKCHIHEIRTKELPELDDEFASDVSEFETLAEYKEGLRKQLSENRKKQADAEREDECVKALIDDSEIELPDAMVETQQRQMVNDMAMQLSMQGLNMQQYQQMTGMSTDVLMEQARPQAIERIKARLVLEAVAAKESITATDEDVEKKLEEMAKQYRMELDKVKELTGEREEKQIREDIAVEKAAKFLVEHAKATKEPKKEADKADGDVPKKRAVPRKKKAEKKEEEEA